ncbi:MAG: prepilin-type N-terminal cleavage/methylation domain-containing protein, partial [Mariprofundales bacterium]
RSIKTVNLTMDSSHFIVPTLRRATKAWQAQAGFTLIEMMVVVAIVGVVTAITIPGYNSLRNAMGLSSATSTLMGHFKQARHLAISHNRSVSIVVSATSYLFDSGANDNNRNQSVTMKQFGSPTLTPSTATFTFSSQGTVNAGNICIAQGNTYKTLTVNIIGRAYICSSGDAGCSC